MAATPYQGFTGQEVAPVNAQQMAGIGDINKYTGQIAGTAAPISAADIQRYQDPYTNQVIQATQADFDTQNARAQSQVTGNAAAQGALGGDRIGVAQALTAEGQARVQAPVIAGLRSQGYQQAVGTAENQQQQALRANQAALQGAGQEIGAGTLQQQTQQAQDTQARQDYYQQQGYPFQVAQWLAAIDTGVGGSMGSTSTSTGQGTTQGPTPNIFSQIAGLGLAGLSLVPKNDGGRITGKLAGFADGGVPGMIEAGNIDLHHRPRVRNPDGSISTVRSEGINVDGQEVLIPTVRANPFRPNTGWIMSDEAARQRYLNTGENLGKFDIPKNSDAYAQQLHEDQAQEYVGRRFGGKIAGFAAGGSPYEGMAQTWVPTASVAAHAPTAHATMPSAPAAPKQAGLSQDQMKGFGVLANKGWNAVNDYADPGSAENPLPGLTAEDYGSWRGGRIKRYASGGFADGGDPTFDERFDAAFPNMTAGVGASRPAFSDTTGPTYDDGQGPMRLTAPEDLDAWRARVDRDNGRKITEAAVSQGEPVPTMVATAPDDTLTLPSEVTAGVSRPRMTASAAPPEGAEEGTSALGYAGTPSLKSGVGTPQEAPEAEKPGGLLSSLGIKMTPELRQGLLQAGLSMMATTRGGPGSFLGAVGEAGMTGVGAYEKTIEAQQKHDLEQAKMAMSQESHQQQMASSPILPDGTINPAWVKMKQQEAEITQKDSWKLVQGDGISTADRLVNSVTGEIKDVPPGKGQEVLNTIQNGQFNYVAGGPRVEKGDQPPEPKSIPGYSSDAIKDDTAYYLVTGDLPKASVSPRNPMGMQSVAYQRLIRNYGAAVLASKGLTADDFADIRRFGKQAARFPLSRQGDQTVAIGTAIRHIGALEEYAKAWDAAKGNVNAPILRQAASRFAKFLGKAEPTNLEQAARIAGPEIIKAIGVAGAGTGGERFAQEEGFQPGASTPQILGAANVARTFLAGQLPAKEAQAAAVHFPHEKFMSMVGPQEYDYLSAINHGKPAEDHGAKAKPTLQEFLTKAKAANPNATDKDLTDYYNKKYGG